MKVLVPFLCAAATLVVLVECAAKSDLASKITAKAAYETCREPAEVHDISPYAFPVAAKVHRHTDCLGIPDMLLIVWYGDRTEKNEVAANLLALMYVENYNDANPEKFMDMDYVKTDELKVDSEKTYINFNILRIRTKGTVL
jgi:hypothetical protein